MEFQHTATRRWLRRLAAAGTVYIVVSTHSHPKVAAPKNGFGLHQPNVSTHSHPKVAAKTNGRQLFAALVSTHSHPKVAASKRDEKGMVRRVSTHSHPKVAAWLERHAGRDAFGFNTQPPEGGCAHRRMCRKTEWLFQHTATRRWLPATAASRYGAGGFNTQPPEGGCAHTADGWTSNARFNTQPPEGGCPENQLLSNP